MITFVLRIHKIIAGLLDRNLQSSPAEKIDFLKKHLHNGKMSFKCLSWADRWLIFRNWWHNLDANQMKKIHDPIHIMGIFLGLTVIIRVKIKDYKIGLDDHKNFWREISFHCHVWNIQLFGDI